MPEFEHLLDGYTCCQDIKGGVCVCTFIFSSSFRVRVRHVMSMCWFLCFCYMMMIFASVCAPVGGRMGAPVPLRAHLFCTLCPVN